MRLPTRVRYGVRALVDLARAYQKGPISAKEMAEGQHVSTKYLQHILAALAAAGVVRPHRGANGGYALTRSPAHVSLAEVFSVLHGPTAFADCVDDPRGCPMTDDCPTRETWIELSDAVKGVLESTTLQDLVDRAEPKSSPPQLH